MPLKLFLILIVSVFTFIIPRVAYSQEYEWTDNHSKLSYYLTQSDFKLTSHAKQHMNLILKTSPKDPFAMFTKVITSNYNNQTNELGEKGKIAGLRAEYEVLVLMESELERADKQYLKKLEKNHLLTKDYVTSKRTDIFKILEEHDFNMLDSIRKVVLGSNVVFESNLIISRKYFKYYEESYSSSDLFNEEVYSIYAETMVAAKITNINYEIGKGKSFSNLSDTLSEELALSQKYLSGSKYENMLLELMSNNEKTDLENNVENYVQNCDYSKLEKYISSKPNARETRFLRYYSDYLKTGSLSNETVEFSLPLTSNESIDIGNDYIFLEQFQRVQEDGRYDKSEYSTLLIRPDNSELPLDLYMSSGKNFSFEGWSKRYSMKVLFRMNIDRCYADSRKDQIIEDKSDFDNNLFAELDSKIYMINVSDALRCGEGISDSLYSYNEYKSKEGQTTFQIKEKIYKLIVDDQNFYYLGVKEKNDGSKKLIYRKGNLGNMSNPNLSTYEIKTTKSEWGNYDLDSKDMVYVSDFVDYIGFVFRVSTVVTGETKEKMPHYKNGQLVYDWVNLSHKLNHVTYELSLLNKETGAIEIVREINLPKYLDDNVEFVNDPNGGFYVINTRLGQNDYSMNQVYHYDSKGELMWFQEVSDIVVADVYADDIGLYLAGYSLKYGEYKKANASIVKLNSNSSQIEQYFMNDVETSFNYCKVKNDEMIVYLRYGQLGYSLDGLSMLNGGELISVKLSELEKVIN